MRDSNLHLQGRQSDNINCNLNRVFSHLNSSCLQCRSTRDYHNHSETSCSKLICVSHVRCVKLEVHDEHTPLDRAQHWPPISQQYPVAHNPNPASQDWRGARSPLMTICCRRARFCAVWLKRCGVSNFARRVDVSLSAGAESKLEAPRTQRKKSAEYKNSMKSRCSLASAQA